VEDKIVKFPDAARHQIFLEPEGHDTAELYVNGLSTSLPAPVQVEILRTVPGLEHARMTRAGYAIGVRLTIRRHNSTRRWPFARSAGSTSPGR